MRYFLTGFFALTIILSGGALQAADEKTHEWTGFLFANGNSAHPDKGGPFKTAEDCFQWGRSKVWRASDEYRCGVDCKRNERGQLVCSTIETEATLNTRLEKEKKEAAPPEPSPSPSVKTKAKVFESSGAVPAPSVSASPGLSPAQIRNAARRAAKKKALLESPSPKPSLASASSVPGQASSGEKKRRVLVS